MKTKFIIPPTEIRIIIEKAAGFVAKNGREFEERILENERNNPKFSFMNAIDPYHLYYRKRLEELIEGGADAISKAITDSKASEAQNTYKMDTNQFEEEAVSSEEPSMNLDELEFLVEFPAISALDLDIVKLTAQFAAKNGKQFILHLAQKESRNPQFDFLKPHHSLNQFYQNFVKQYSLIFNPTERMLDRVKRCAFRKQEQLSQVTHRARMEKLERDKMKQEMGLEESQREAYSKINWNDFTVAETVIFAPEDQELNLPGPINIEALKTMPLTQRLEIWTGRKVELNTTSVPEASSNSKLVNDDEEEMEIEEDFRSAASATPVTVPSKRPNEIIMGAAFGGAAVKVRTDYVPRASSAASSSSSVKSSSEEVTQVCSICKASVPVSQIDEHIRIELLDPKWRQQRMSMLAKNRDSNILETGTDVSRNLEQLARHRTDIFGSSGTDVKSAGLIERGPTRPIWDGHVESIPQINRAAQIMAKPQIEQEMAALQQSGDYSLNPSKGIGPRAPLATPRPPFMPLMIPGMPPMIPGMPFPPTMPLPPALPPMQPGQISPGFPYFPGMPPFPPSAPMQAMPPPHFPPPKSPQNQQEKKQ